MSTLDNNLTALRSCYPDLAARLDDYPDKDKVYIFQAKDGGIGYGLQENGKKFPLTDPVSPFTRICSQLEQNSTRLIDCTKQVLIVGLYPGEELLYIFALENKQTKLHAQQKIFVCVDSLPCLYGFLQAFDAGHVIKSPRIHFFWHENTNELVNWLRNHPEHPYTFTLVSCAANNILDRVMPPIAGLIQERKTETDRLIKENNQYYNTISDNHLAEVIASAQARAPRLMMTTCSWSTVVQYSARDTCRAFEACGWNVRHLNTDSMLTAYYVAKEINEFKPDVFIFINHLRTEATAAYPENMLFLTWIQDPNPSINTPASAREWNEFSRKRNRDFIIGYVGQLEKYGYAPDRLFATPMIVNTDTFKPRQITADQKARYGCDVLFASRAGHPSRERVEELLAEWNQDKNLDCPRNVLTDLHDCLWEAYRAGETFTGYEAVEIFVLAVPSFAEWYSFQSEEDRDYLRQQIFWSLNDLIYRQIVVEWLADYAEAHPGFTLHLYGEGWDRHPRFVKYWKGVLKHGEELSIAFQCARWCLHLNSMEGGHQRLLEIIASGGHPLTRASPQKNPDSVPLHSALRACAEDPARWRAKLPETQAQVINEWLYPSIVSMLKKAPLRSQFEAKGGDPAKSDADIAQVLDTSLIRRLWNHSDWTVSGWDSLCFQTRAELEQMLPRTPDCDMKAAAQRLASVNDQNLARSIASALARYLVKTTAPAQMPENPWQDMIQYARLLPQSHISVDELLTAFRKVKHPPQQIIMDTAKRLNAAGAHGQAAALLDKLDPERMTGHQLIIYANGLADMAFGPTVSATGGCASPDPRSGRVAHKPSDTRILSLIARAYARDEKLQDAHSRIAWKHFWPRKEYDKVIEWMERDAGWTVERPEC